MSFNTNPIVDSNSEFIYFTGKISKHVLSKQNNNIIGVNINDLKVFDNFYKEEGIVFMKSLQDKNVKLYKKKIPRPFLILFAPKSLNKNINNLENFPLDTYIKFKVERGIKKTKDKEEYIYNASDLEMYKTHNKNIEKKYGTGIFIDSKFKSINELSFKSPELINLLDKIYDTNSGDIDTILNLNTLINKWLSKGIEIQKQQEYETERKILESKKKAEVKETSDALIKALQSVKSIYGETMHQT